MNTQLCKTILEIVISLTIQSGVIIGAALAVSKWLGRRGAAHQAILLRSAIMAVLLCAALSFGLAGRVHPLISLSLPAAPAISPVDVASPIDTPAAPANTDQYVSPSGSVADQTAAVKASAVAAPDNTEVRKTPVATTPTHHGISLLSSTYFVGAVIWLAGALALLIWLLACQFHLFLIARRSSLVSSGPAWEALQNLCSRSSKRPRLLTSRAVKSPFIAGVRKPSIFVPFDFEERFASDAIALVIAHELCHLRRRDGLWTLLARLTRIALWIQPLAWLLERRLQDTFEALCDAEVIAQGQVSASRYADCLVGMAEHLAMPPALRAVGLGVVPFRSSLAKRVQAILSGTRSLVQPITPALRMAIAVGAATLALACVLLVTARIPSRAASHKVVGNSKVVHSKASPDKSTYDTAEQAYAKMFSGPHGSLGLIYIPGDQAGQRPQAAGVPSYILSNGALVLSVVPSGPAAAAGIQPGDVILLADQQAAVGVEDKLSSMTGIPGGELSDNISNHKPGDKIQLLIWRSGKVLPVTVTLGKASGSPIHPITPVKANAPVEEYRVYLYGDQPTQNEGISLQFVDPNSKYQQAPGFAVPPGSPYLGVQYAPAAGFTKTPAIMHMPADVVKNGMVVVRVVPGSPAASAGIRQYDIIWATDGQYLGGKVMLLRKAIESHEVGMPMNLVIFSHGKSRSITVIVGKAPAVKKQSLRPSGPPPWTPYGATPNSKGSSQRIQLSPPQSGSASQIVGFQQQELRAQSLADASRVRQLRRDLYVMTTIDLKVEKHSPAKEREVREDIKAVQAQIQALEANETATQEQEVILNRWQRSIGPIPGPEIWSSK